MFVKLRTCYCFVKYIRECERFAGSRVKEEILLAERKKQQAKIEITNNMSKQSAYGMSFDDEASKLLEKALSSFDGIILGESK